MNAGNRLLPAITLAFLPLFAHAADVMSAEQIVRALHPAATGHSRTRGLMRRDASETPASTVSPAATVAAESSATAAPPAVNLNIAFEYNSSNLKPQAAQQLTLLAKALSSDALARDRFLIAGHTDAQGSAAYNKHLSQRRAESVKRFLVANGLESARLDTAGFGAEQPLLPDQPLDPSNRRVEIRDLGAAAIP